jgi:prepilin-type N-terminal cleavage/methylation domain-containing protein
MRNRGFTIIEVMVVVAIIAILAAVGGYGLRSWVPRMDLKSEAREILNDIKQAQVEAVKRNRESHIFVSGDSYTVTSGSFTRSVALEESQVGAWSHNGVGFNPRGVTIDGAGDPILGNATVQVFNDSGNCTVTCNTVGMMSLDCTY